MLNKLCFELLKTWCDKMVELQITERKHKLVLKTDISRIESLIQ